MQNPYEIITFWILLLIVIISQNQALEMSTINILTRVSLVAQLIVRLPGQETWVQSLIGKDPTRCGAK